MSTFLAVPEKHIGMTEKIISCGLLTFLILCTCAAPALSAFEQPPVLQAKNILQPELLKGTNYQVQDAVKNDGLFNHYIVESKFGTFTADSTGDLKILINEINAIAEMKQIETDDTVMASLQQSGQNTVTGVKNLVNDPQGTLEGAAAGVSSLFNRAKKTVGTRKISDAEDSQFEQLVGISKSKGMIANKYGANVYSGNKVLQEELDRLGRADYFGGLGVGMATSVVPGVGGLVLTTSGTARLINEAINTTPASELWLQNKNKLTAMGINTDTVKLFLNNPSFSPAQSTVLVAALEAMQGVDNRELFIKISLQAANAAMAKTIVKIAVMSAGYHQKIAPLKTITTMARVTRGIRKDGTQVALLPADYLTWNQLVAETATFISSEAKNNGLEVWVLGSVSKQATLALQQQGWKIHTETASQLLPARK